MRVFAALFCLPLVAQSPVLVELFTSEGCSSCPPADELLAKLERREVIVLSEHVDYWDQLGWRDPFSNAQFTRRQAAYVARLNASGNYTPQMVVDGRFEMVGSDARRAVAAIAEATARPKVALRLTTVSRDAERWTIRVAGQDVPAGAELWAAVAEPAVQTQVARGENGGRALRHVGVARSLRSLGTVPAGPLDREVALRVSSPQQRAVVFLQGRHQGPVLAVSLLDGSERTGTVAASDAKKK